MTDARALKSFPLYGLVSTAVLLLAVTGCKAQRSQDTTAPAAVSTASGHVAASDPVTEAHQRGREWAMRVDAKLVTDCGALDNEDERFGCADYVNHLPQ